MEFETIKENEASGREINSGIWTVTLVGVLVIYGWLGCRSLAFAGGRRDLYVLLNRA
jgi:hypothetical protein